jgi:SAM-dependent methyltransferase
MNDASLPPSYFEDVYRAKLDPWDFASSPYEAAKYQATLAALPRARYDAAFEAGCSIGVLTEQLAPRCAQLLAVDVNDSALDQARTRCARFPHLRFARGQLPAEFPEADFDLILISEVGYYLAYPDLLGLRAVCINRLRPGGHLLLVHWTPPVPDYPLTGDQVHAAFLELANDAQAPWRRLAARREEKYRLDLLERVAPAN